MESRPNLRVAEGPSGIKLNLISVSVIWADYYLTTGWPRSDVVVGYTSMYVHKEPYLIVRL